MLGVASVLAEDMVKAAQELQHLVQQRDDLLMSVHDKLRCDPNGTCCFNMGSSSFLLPINSPRCRRVLAEILQGADEQIAQAEKYTASVMAMFQDMKSNSPELPPATPLGMLPAAAPPPAWDDVPAYAPSWDVPDPDESPVQFVSEPL